MTRPYNQSTLKSLLFGTPMGEGDLPHLPSTNIQVKLNGHYKYMFSLSTYINAYDEAQQ